MKKEGWVRHRSAIPTSSIPQNTVLVVVHPGSACGSADFNYASRQIAEVARQMLIQELQDWLGAVVVIDGALSRELAAYPQLNHALNMLLARAASAKLTSLRVFGDDPHQDRVIRSLVGEWKPSTESTEFVVTGAWHYSADEGCVGSVCATIRKLGYRATISPAALSGETSKII